jgi:hypothetical protein
LRAAIRRFNVTSSKNIYTAWEKPLVMQIRLQAFRLGRHATLSLRMQVPSAAALEKVELHLHHAYV